MRKYYATFFYLKNDLKSNPIEDLPNFETYLDGEGGENNKYEKITGEFKYFLIANLPWIAKSFNAMPKNQINDGYCDTVLIQNKGRCPLLSLLLNQDNGDYYKKDGSLKEGV